MSDHSNRNAAVNAAADVKVHHATFDDVQVYVPKKAGYFRRVGIRKGPGHSRSEIDQLINKIPPSQRAGRNGHAAARRVKVYIKDKDGSHVKPYIKGGSSHPDNLRWEEKSANRSRGNKPMTKREQARLDQQAFADNITGSLKAGVAAMPRGAAIGAVTALPFSLLRNALRVVRGEITTQEAAIAVGKDSLFGSGIGAASAFTITTVATACPPIAIALATMSPALLVAGGVGMAYEFFKILEDHKKDVRKFYDSLTEQQLSYLQKIESELVYEHEKAIALLEEAQQTAEAITNRPRAAGVEGALQRFMESKQIAQNLHQSKHQKQQLSGTAPKQLPSCSE